MLIDMLPAAAKEKAKRWAGQTKEDLKARAKGAKTRARGTGRAAAVGAGGRVLYTAATPVVAKKLRDPPL